MEILGIPEDIFLNPNIVKIYDGIAGSAKSSNIDAYFKAAGIRYGRYTSTNRLRNDAEERYGGDNYTIAGGLFKTVNGKFYAEAIDTEHHNVVIDEILQASPEVIDWIKDNTGKHNIIICTDSRQTLTPGNGEKMLAMFEELKKSAYVSTLDKSYRPRNDKTAEIYAAAYKSVYDEKVFMRVDKGTKEPEEYEENAVYIVHTKALEKALYDRFNLYQRYDLPLIPKGAIASRPPKDKTKYPILPQCMAAGRDGYFQISNIATPTRFQGSEVPQGTKGYYVVESTSAISNREAYTVISRFHDIGDFEFMIMNIPRQSPPKTFNGKPVKGWYTAEVSPDHVCFDGETIRQKMENAPKITEATIDGRDMDIILSGIDRSIGDYVPRRDRVICNGIEIRLAYEKPIKTARTMRSLLKKEATFSYAYTPEIYRILDDFGRRNFHVYGIHGASINDAEYMRKPESYQYALDLKAAYPHVLNFCDMPTCNEISTEPIENGINWYIVGHGGYFPRGRLIKEDCIKYARDPVYVFSTSSQHGSKMGAYLHEQAHKSIEAKDRIKSVHYGYAERQYLEVLEYNSRTDAPDYYVLNEANDHALLMCSIRSDICRVMSGIREEVYGDISHGRTCVDCLYFDYLGDIIPLADAISARFPDFDFRIKDNKTDSIIYQTYDDLMTDAERKKYLRKAKKSIDKNK